MPDKQTIFAYDPTLGVLIAEYVREQLGLTPGAKAPVGGGQIPSRQVILVKVTSNAAGGEKYKAQPLGPGKANILSTGDLALSDLGTIDGPESVLFLNCEAIDNPTGHVLTEDGQTPIAIGIVVGYNEETPPLLVVKGFSLNYAPCS